ncbi:bifunctional DNA primase/polymerase [Nocardia cyriacigeorgica]|uniref:bifunctional DNA primase/polymerase n=1 Tax=Nocardia cyriacigeorgica TaxID=135487 RepID=UPI0014865C75|nr:bifunctional DNA primase/polymerase [Nocardia cyriacigeorgica]
MGNDNSLDRRQIGRPPRVKSVPEGRHFRIQFEFQDQRLHIPVGLADMSPADAALAYAEAGWYVVPVKPGTKNPGSLIGGWTTQSTRDHETISGWWKKWPDAGIALHAGRSGVVIFDCDVPDLSILPVKFRKALRQGLFQRSRQGEVDRGHYLFAVPKGESYRNGAGAFRLFGDVRGQNGVVLAEPTPHPSEGGRYHWPAPGVLPPLPDALRECLRSAGDDAEPLRPAELDAFYSEHTHNERPGALDAIVRQFRKEVDEGSSRHEALMRALPWAFREARIGRFSARDAADQMRAAYKEMFQGVPGRRPDPGEFDRAAKWAAAQALTADEAEIRARINRDDPGRVEPARKRFTIVSAAELAQPVPPMEWSIRGVWPRRSFGPWAGEKKTLKTYNLLALTVALTSGKPMLGEFEVVTPGPVLYFVGEGGRHPFQRRLQAVAGAYGADLHDLPIGAVFDVASLTSRDFTDAVKRGLDEMQPELVIVDPLYAFHPPGVEAQNLYERGRMLTELGALVNGESGLIVADHFKKTGSAELDLDSIAQAGMGQWADSWALQQHREKPNLDTGEYRLSVEFGSRQWGGARYEIDWTLPAITDLESGDVTAPEITWSVRQGVGRQGNSDREDLGRVAEQILSDHPFEFTKSQLTDKEMGGSKAKNRRAVDAMLAIGTAEIREITREENGRSVRRRLIGLAEKPKLKYGTVG